MPFGEPCRQKNICSWDTHDSSTQSYCGKVERQKIATGHSPDVGFHAVADPSCMQDHFHQILPEADIEAVNAMYTKAAEEQLLGGSPDYVLDAIDNIDTKVELLAACHRRGLPVLSSAGAGMGFFAASLAGVDA